VTDWIEERQQLTDRLKQLNNFALQAANDKNWPQAISQIQEAINLCQQCPQLGILHKNIGLIYVRKGEQQLQLAFEALARRSRCSCGRGNATPAANVAVLDSQSNPLSRG